MAAALPQFGCTSFLPTLLSCDGRRDPSRPDRSSAEGLLQAPPESGAQALGVHMEGPFLAPDRAGAHDRRLPPHAIATADLARWVDASAGGSLRLLTLAPELPGASEVIREAVQCGVAVAVGHTAATYERDGAGPPGLGHP